MLGVRDRIADGLDGEICECSGEMEGDTNVLQQDLEDSARLFVDETFNTLDITLVSETADSGLRDTHGVVVRELGVTLCATLSGTLRIGSVAADFEERPISNTPFEFHSLPHPCAVIWDVLREEK